MKLKSLLLRYYPPGIMLEYEKGGELKTKSIDLLELSTSTDVNTLVEEIQKAEPLITVSRTQQVRLLVQRLQEKLRQHCEHSFYLFKMRTCGLLTGKYGFTNQDPLKKPLMGRDGLISFRTADYDPVSKTCEIFNAP